MEQQYLMLLRDILQNGELRKNRTDIASLSVFSRHLSFDISKTIPLLTTKYVWFSGIVHELLWFLSGEQSTEYLQKHNVAIWHPWQNENSDVGRVYGVQWRRWENRHGKKVDQIAKLIDSLRNDPYSRRHLLVAWNPGELEEMSLAPCHVLAQFFVNKDKALSCQFYQRSVDTFIGLPFNLVSYALLTKMIAQLCDMKTDKLYFVGGDVHLYENQLKQVRIQLERDPYPFPLVEIDSSISNIDDFEHKHFKLHSYQFHEALKVKIAV